MRRHKSSSPNWACCAPNKQTMRARVLCFIVSAFMCVVHVSSFSTTGGRSLSRPPSTQIAKSEGLRKPELRAARAPRSVSDGLLRTRAGLEVIEPSYNLAVGATVLGTIFGVYDLRTPRLTLYSIPGILFGLLLLYQTTLHRFAFDDSAFILARKEHLFATGEEKLVFDTERRWEYNHFANYDFFPSYQFPILVYVKETQSPPHLWNDGPGKTANSEEAIANGAKPGQVHFFPAFGNAVQMQAAFDHHRCQKLYISSD